MNHPNANLKKLSDTKQEIGSWQHIFLSVGLILATGVTVYWNSFEGAFVLDDHYAIIDNVRIRHPWSLGPLITAAPRPLVEISLAFNYALGGLKVWGYHMLNLAIHLLAGIVLFRLVHWTLLTERLKVQFGSSAPWLALVISLLWVVHPLQTQSVTYIIQRAESLMGLCYLLTLYCAVRSRSSPYSKWWSFAAVMSCMLGICAKPIMVTAPLIVLCYDRTFLSGSWVKALLGHWKFYLGLVASWVLLAFLLLHVDLIDKPSVGFGLEKLTPIQYAFTQTAILLHYLRLTLWPHPLVFDYTWQVAAGWETVLLPTMIVGILLVATIWSLRRYPALGFLGTCFFVILAPTSSIIPIADLAVEHRMYLPLAVVIILLVLCTQGLLRKLFPVQVRMRQFVAVGLVIISTFGLGLLTHLRNNDYRSEEILWKDTIAKRPANPRAYMALGRALRQQGRFSEAVSYLSEALRLKPDYARAHENLGVVLASQGRLDEAIDHYNEALRIEPDLSKAHDSLGVALYNMGKIDEAIDHYNEALSLKPDFGEVYSNLGLALAEIGKIDQAIAHYAKALQLKPDFAEAYFNWGVALAGQNKLEEAKQKYSRALLLKPNYAHAHENLAVVLAEQGRFEEAIKHFSKALKINPDDSITLNNLGIAFTKTGQFDRAIGHFSKALELKPNFVEARIHLQNAIVKQNQGR